MAEKDDNQHIDYGQYSYKNYVWKESGRFEKPREQPLSRFKKAGESDGERTTKKGGGVKIALVERRHIIAVCAIVICFCLTILLADVVSTGGIASLISWVKGSESDGDTYYALAVDKYDKESYASITADELRQLGGGGYVIYDNDYYLIASVYASKEDAETVLARIKTSASSTAQIYTITLSTPKLNWVSGDAEGEVESILKYGKELFAGLYSVSVSLDGGEITEYQARTEIKALSAEIQALSLRLKNVRGNSSSVQYTKIAAELTAVTAVLDNLLNTGLPRYNLLSDVRYSYTFLLLSYKNLLSVL